MTARERVIRAIEFRNPDRVPLWPRVCGTAWTRYGKALADLLAKYPIDLGPRVEEESRRDKEPPTAWADDWGCAWRTQRADYFGFVVEHPLADKGAMASYRFPDYSLPEYDSRFAELLRESARKDRDRYAIASGVEYYGALWYRMLWLRGTENLFMDLAADVGFALELLDNVLKSQLSYLRQILAVDADGIQFGDDWGTMNALMIAPDTWRQVFKPAYKKLFDAVHDAGKHVIFETDGCTTDILGDWADVGVDLLSVQMNVVDLDKVAEHRGDVCFYSDPDQQRILPRGTPADVDQHIREIVSALADPRGGLIGCVYVDDSVPLQNVEAALDAFVRYG